jgi:predicted acyl esterase
LAALDRDRPPGWPRPVAALGRLLGGGVRPVDEDQRGAELARIVNARRNARFGDLAAGIEARDDALGEARIPIGEVGLGESDARIRSVRKRGRGAAAGPGVAIWATWGDGGGAAAALRLWAARPAVREVHLGRADAAPEEMATFVAASLAAREIAGAPLDQRCVIYATTGVDGAQATSVWPPPGVEPHELFVARDGRLRWAQGHDVGSLEIRLDAAASSGRRNRWHARLAEAGGADARRDARPETRPGSTRGRTSWTSEPLAEPVTITGQPVVVLAVRVPAEDVTLFASLDALPARGEVRALSDGQFRAVHRARPPAEPTFLRRAMRPLLPGERTELRIPLAPISARIDAGWRLRLSLAGADRETFRVPPDQPRSVTLEYGGPASSRLLLPTVEG